MGSDQRETDVVTEAIIGCAFRVLNQLGCGFLEKVYENALAHEVKKSGLEIRQQTPIIVRYDGIVVGDYVADLVVENRVLIELKAASGIEDVHVAQTLNYLKATGLKVGLILNFGKPRLDIKRLTN